MAVETNKKSAPKVNPKTRHPMRVQNVGTVNLIVKDEASLSNALQRIQVFVSRVDRFGVVNVNVSEAPASKGKKSKEEADAASMLD